MNHPGISYAFTAEIWVSEWHFVSLPEELADEIRDNFKYREEGWGRLKVTAKIGSSEWKTAIWFDTKHDTYLLPVKSEIRKKEKIDSGQTVKVVLWL